MQAFYLMAQKTVLRRRKGGDLPTKLLPGRRRREETDFILYVLGELHQILPQLL